MKKFDIDTSLIDKLSDMLEKNQLNEIEYTQGDQKIRVTKQQSQHNIVAAPAPMAAVPQASQPEAITVKNNAAALTSPMVGTAYLSPSPDQKPFVSIGDIVNKGDTVLIIEAMKVMNQIKAKHSGKITDILVSNEDPVEFGQELIIIE